MSLEIKNIEELIQSSLKYGQKFVSCQCEKLLSDGENYGSVMLRVKITVSNTNNEEEIVHCVAKTTPPRQLIWEMFNTKVTFKKEINVYKELVPALNEFGKEKGIDTIISCVPKCLGARVSANPESLEVDENAVLLLENLQVQGYINCDRSIGFNLESAKFLLNDLAILHATPIAYKLEKPDDFKTKILPYLTRDFALKIRDDALRDFIKVVRKFVSAEEECIPYLTKVEEAIFKFASYTLEKPLRERDTFATFTHNDFWMNNTMLNFEDGKPIKNKIIDFQTIEYRSLAHDVIFFLYNSLEVSVLENHLDELLKYYHDRFIDILTKLKCDVGGFTFDAMMEEFAYVAKEEELGHIIIMQHGTILLKDIFEDCSTKNEMYADEDALHKDFYKKTVFTLLNFVKRGWLTK